MECASGDPHRGEDRKHGDGDVDSFRRCGDLESVEESRRSRR